MFRQKSYRVKHAARKEREVEILEWKLDALENIEEDFLNGLEQTSLERKLLERKYLETIFLKSELLGITFQKLKSKQQRFLPKGLLRGKLSESYSNSHASPSIHVPQRCFHS
ncbi:hypothetical protein RVIR1_07960 [Candidatus Rickettsiella viridis]|uniref:Uncharacterized protein n=1 Tax=Candidatus Rickettsiella viridis TaxID=676208 RepID=A0A2Z5UW42_9COXI|nr:hypothetical protein [Candidatus Rickettsiella viridis]BBB15285.1 hypothetical protein RVIR1_07960 [Candidatus Rickettsiella viridis]